MKTSRALLICLLVTTMILSYTFIVTAFNSVILGDPIDDPKPNLLILGDPIDDPKPN